MSAIPHPDQMQKFYIDGKMADYQWAQALDLSLLVSKGEWHQNYPRASTIVFNDGAISMSEWGTFSTKPGDVWLRSDGTPYPEYPELPVNDELVIIIDAPASAYTSSLGADGKSLVISRNGQSNEFPTGSSVVFYDKVVNLNHANELHVYDYTPGSALRIALPDATKLVGFEPDGDVVTSPNGIQDAAAIAALEKLYAGDSGSGFDLSGPSADYGWGLTEDGSGMVVWKGSEFEIFDKGTSIRFSDAALTIANDKTIVLQKNSGQVSYGASYDQSHTGTPEPTDPFYAKALGAYGWGPTDDGSGMVIWSGAASRIVDAGTTIRFADGYVTIAADKTIVMQKDGGQVGYGPSYDQVLVPNPKALAAADDVVAASYDAKEVPHLAAGSFDYSDLGHADFDATDIAASHYDMMPDHTLA